MPGAKPRSACIIMYIAIDIGDTGKNTGTHFSWKGVTSRVDAASRKILDPRNESYFGYVPIVFVYYNKCNRKSTVN